jgi:uncharacterized protein involved in copper resistance
MELLNNVSSSTIYQQLAQKRAELASIDKKEIEQESSQNYNKINTPDEKYDEKDYQRVLSKFEARDQQIRMHEQSHASNAATSTAIQYNYQTGPDGKIYAVGGSVRYDTSIPKDPASAEVKLQQLQKAASSPDELSAADLQIARTANLNKMLIQSRGETTNEY